VKIVQCFSSSDDEGSSQGSGVLRDDTPANGP
jgi:hypothetical protein